MGADGKKAYAIVYQTTEDNPHRILMDATDVIRTATSDIGDSVVRYEVTAKYGTREFRVIAPAPVAISLTRGTISREKFLGVASVTLDGNPISPNYR